MYPALDSLAFCENLFGSLWMTAPVQYLFANPVLSFNVLFFLSFVLSAMTMTVLAFELTSDFWASALAGLIFSYSPYKFAHVGHIQLMSIFWSPLCLYFLHRFMDQREKKRHTVLLGACLAFLGQIYSSIYLGIMLYVTVLAWLSLRLWSMQHRKDWLKVLWADRLLRRYFWISCAIGVLALAPLMWPYVQVARTWGFGRSIDEVRLHAIEPLSLFLSLGAGAHHGWLSARLSGWVRGGEAATFVGWTPWILALLAVFWRKKWATAPHLKLYMGLAVFLVLIMMGPNLIWAKHDTPIPLFYRLVYYLVPGAQAIRVPARFVLLLLLALSVLSAYGVSFLREYLRKHHPLAPPLATLFLGAFLLWDYSLVPQTGVEIPTAAQLPPAYGYLQKGPADRPVL